MHAVAAMAYLSKVEARPQSSAQLSLQHHHCPPWLRVKSGQDTGSIGTPPSRDAANRLTVEQLIFLPPGRYHRSVYVDSCGEAVRGFGRDVMVVEKVGGVVKSKCLGSKLGSTKAVLTAAKPPARNTLFPPRAFGSLLQANYHAA